MTERKRFADRAEAGRAVAARLAHYTERDPLVLALPRGGLPIAAEIVNAIGGTLDILVVRKLGVPWQPELGMGALVEGGRPDIDWPFVERLGVTENEVLEVIGREKAELERRVRRYRRDRPFPNLAGRTVILVDDGIATGGTMFAAARTARQLGAARVVVAVPVASPSALERMAKVADEIACPLRPPDLHSVGAWYTNFDQVDDAEVDAILLRARQLAA